MKNFQNKVKIAKVGEALRTVLFFGLCLWIFAFFASLVPLAFVYIFPEQGVYPIQIYVWIGSAVCTVFGFIVNLRLFRFFDRIKNGRLFDAQTVGCLDAAGKWWLAFWSYEGFFYGIRTICFQVKMSWDFGSLFAALTLIFVAWLLKEAQGLQEEQELTV